MLGTDDALEALLRKAPPRPMPAGEDTAAVHDAVKDEWLAVTGRRRTRRRLISLVAAATVLLAVGVTVTLLRVPSALPVQVATIDKTIGSIHFLGEQSQLREMRDLAEVIAGQTIVTGHDSAASINWTNGGSLRIDEDTRVEFISPEEILLKSGRVYFDSQPSSLQAGITQSSVSGFAIRTEQGVVRHIGTQYMTGISGGALTISVREGQVEVEGTYHDTTAKAGQRLTLAGSNRPAITNIPSHGDDWRWVEQIAPAINFDERSAYEFIHWVARESGFEVRFVSGTVERRARDTKMTGSVDREPQVALQTLLKTTTLNSRIDNGWIVISER